MPEVSWARLANSAADATRKDSGAGLADAPGPRAILLAASWLCLMMQRVCPLLSVPHSIRSENMKPSERLWVSEVRSDLRRCSEVECWYV